MTKINFFHSRFLAVNSIALLLASLSASSAWAVPTVEVVQSVPIETTLAVPGVRSTQTVWLEMIRGATSTLDIEQFYVSNQAGQSLEPVLNALQDAFHRGVKIRLLVDAKFYQSNPADVNSLVQTGALAVKTVDFSNLGGIMHAKYLIADQKISYVGSANFDWLALSHIHEVGLRVVDVGMAAELKTVFDHDWSNGLQLGHTLGQGASSSSQSSGGLTSQDKVAHLIGTHNGGGTPLSDSPDPRLEMLASPSSANPSGVDTTIDHVLTLLGSARQSIKIQVYEYTTKDKSSPWKSLDAAIRAAAARGVAVELMVDAVALKQGRADLASLAAVQGVQVKTVVIPQWSGGPLQFARLIHSKYFVVDHVSAWVGSENWSKGYFFSSRNVGFITYSSDAAATLEQIYDRVWTSDYAKSM